jgi:NADH-quinone oxidoreductase subunit C
MEAQQLFETLKATFGDAILECKSDVLQPYIVIAPDKTKRVAEFLHDDPATQFNSLKCLSGVDYNDGKLGVVVHLNSMTLGHHIVVKYFCTKENPHVQSICSVWATANWHEREAFDLFGIVFDEHPDPRRILLPDDWEGYPLRKDYRTPEFYNGMKVPY